MGDEFNPYYLWLGIPPDELPANHYRLLGLRLFETSGDVIDSAADRQMAHLRTFQGSKYGQLSQRLLNEVATARVCLLDARKRVVYDQQLRARSPAAPAANLSQAVATPVASETWDALLGNDAAKPKQNAGTKSADLLKATATKQRQAKSRMVSIGVVAAVVLLVAAAIGVYSLNSNSDGTLVFDWPAEDRADASVTVDNKRIKVPASGPWEVSFPAGSHHIAAQRPALKFNAEVNIVPGQRLRVSPDWKAKALLMLNWPLAERDGAVLKVDGRQRQVSHHEPLEVPVDPGSHRIEVTRPNTATFSASTVVGADLREIVLITRPSEATASPLTPTLPAGQKGPPEIGEATATGETPAVANSDKLSAAGKFPHGKWIDLLGMVDTAKNVVSGSWSRNGSEISCEPTSGARIEVPVVVDGSYEVEVEFTRTDGVSDVNVILPVSSHEFIIKLSANDGVSGLEMIDGHGVEDSANPTTINPGKLENGHRYWLQIKVQVKHPDLASIDVALDGKPYLPHWEGKPASLDIPTFWVLPNRGELGLATYKDRVTFHSMRLRLQAGEAKPASQLR